MEQLSNPGVHGKLPLKWRWWYVTMYLSMFGVLRDGGGGHWLVRMEWRPAEWSACLPLLIFPCTIKSRSSLLALAHPGGPGKRAVKQLWCGMFGV